MAFNLPIGAYNLPAGQPSNKSGTMGPSVNAGSSTPPSSGGNWSPGPSIGNPPPSSGGKGSSVGPFVTQDEPGRLGELNGSPTDTYVGGTYSQSFKKGGKVKKPTKKMAKGGSAASKRADGCCTKGKTKGRFV